MRFAAGLLLMAAPTAVHATVDSSPIDLPAGALGQAVAALSRQARIDVGVDDPALHQVRTRPVRGRMSAETALDRLLRDTPATWRRGRGGLFHIVRRSRPVAIRAALDPARRPIWRAPPIPPVEIVITASKRDARLDDYPAMVTLLPGDALGAGAVPGSDAIVQALPGAGSTQLGPGRNKLFLRGVIDSSFHGPGEAATAQYLDHVRINHNGPDPSLRLYDLAAVEILEGPQGTLYGAGSLGGLIRLVTNRPRLDRTEGRFTAGLSHVEHGEPGADAAAMLNLPLVDNRAALRLVGYAAREGGYIDNPVLGKRDINRVSVRGARSALRLDAGAWTIDIDGVLQSIRAADSQWTDRTGERLTRRSAVREPYSSDYRQTSLAAERDIGDVHFVASLAKVGRKMAQRYDKGALATPLAVTQHDRSGLLVGEVRLSQGRDGSAGWVAGASLLDSDGRTRRGNGDSVEGLALRQEIRNATREVTLFGEADIVIANGLVATAGLRLSHTRLRGWAWAKDSLLALPGNGRPIVAGLAESNLRLLPGLALGARMSDRLYLFARYQEGFRSGGAGVAGARPEIHRGDRLRSWEIGQRLKVGDRADVDVALSYARWNGILAELVSQTGDLMIANIGDGEIASVETRASWRPSSNWTLQGGLSWTYSRLTRPDIATIALKGGRLPNVPRFGMQASASREWQLSGRLRAKLGADLRYFGGSRIGAGPLLDSVQGRYVDDRLFLRLGEARRALSLEVSNLLDTDANRFALGNPYRIYDPQMTPQRPRTVRVGFDAAF